MAGTILQNALIFLGAALVFVPLAKKLGVGSVLGYILGGIIIGPFVLQLVGHEGEDVMHAAEFGVVMMLFIIGLELNPQSFWRMKKTIVGMGGLQMLATAVILLPLLHWVLAVPWNASLALALSFAMSSTAIVLQTLKEKNLNKTQAGQSSFAVLLFQDIAVIPVLAVFPLLAGAKDASDIAEATPDLLSRYPTLTIGLAVLGVYLVSRFLISPFLHYISRVHMRELFTASALFLVIGVAWVMEQVGVSAALGAFMAGVLLANSEFRHELESDIEPFKGLLLGLFFTAVGSTINFHLIAENPGRILLAVALIMAVKGLVLFLLGKIFKLISDQNLLFTLLLCQVGEFAFVLLGSAMQLELFDKSTLDFFMAVITISMVFSTVLLFLNERFFARYFGVKVQDGASYEVNPEETKKVIIAGFGHFGSTIGRFLRANGVNATILDNDSDRVILLRKMGFKVYFGDATRVDLLEAAGAASAGIMISAIDSPERNLELAETVKKHFPHLKLFMRARNRVDAYEFLEMGVEQVYRESLHASVNLGVDVLAELGLRKYTLHRKASDFIRADNAALRKLAAERHNKEGYISSVRAEIEMQEKLLNEDRQFTDQKTDSAWDKSPLIRG
jgi:monovalent cation:H+ antiporter-2, CPA2 family